MIKFLTRLGAVFGSIWNAIWSVKEDARPPAASKVASSAYTTAFLEDDLNLPKNLNQKVVYIIGVKGNEWLAVLSCPCGCGSKIQLNLLKEEKPFWTWGVNERGAPTLSPSVWRTVGCKSHFFVRAGAIQWCS